MPPKTRGRPSGTGTTPPVFDPAAMEIVIQERIAAALVEYELAHPTGGGGGGGGSGPEIPGGGGGNPRPCSYKDFMSCKPHEFAGTGGVIELTRWFEKTESVFQISNCSADNQVKFAACTFMRAALSWWNTHVQTMGIVHANALTWGELKTMMIEIICFVDWSKLTANDRSSRLPRKLKSSVVIQQIPNDRDQRHHKQKRRVVQAMKKSSDTLSNPTRAASSSESRHGPTSSTPGISRLKQVTRGDESVRYIRRASGEKIAIQETRRVPDEINGPASQNSAATATPPIQFPVHSVGLSSLLSGPIAKTLFTSVSSLVKRMKFSHLDIASRPTIIADFDFRGSFEISTSGKTAEFTSCASPKVFDQKSLKTVVLISAKEEPEASIPPAKDGLLKVHQRVIDAKHMVFIESVIVFNGLDCYTVFQVPKFENSENEKDVRESKGSSTKAQSPDALFQKRTHKKKLKSSVVIQQIPNDRDQRHHKQKRRVVQAMKKSSDTLSNPTRAASSSEGRHGSTSSTPGISRLKQVTRGDESVRYIRRASGATIAIQETRRVPDEINGAASQNSAATATPPIQFPVHSVGLSSLLSGPIAKTLFTSVSSLVKRMLTLFCRSPGSFEISTSGKTAEFTSCASPKVFDQKSLKTVVLISAKEEPEASIPPAKDGLLKVHQHVIDAKHMVFIESVIVFNGLDCYTVFQVPKFENSENEKDVRESKGSSTKAQSPDSLFQKRTHKKKLKSSVVIQQIPNDRDQRHHKKKRRVVQALKKSSDTLSNPTRAASSSEGRHGPTSSTPGISRLKQIHKKSKWGNNCLGNRRVPDEINGPASQNSAATATPPIQFPVHSVGLSSLLSGPNAKITKFSHLDYWILRVDQQLWWKTEQAVLDCLRIQSEQKN
ncbi:hypothetical protein LXL04_020538 [Taraxacum kok-saghyz]